MTNSNSNIFTADLKKLNDLEIQKKYLNCLEWTDTIINALSELEDEFQALRIINLALEVDLILGATLAGAINENFQQQAIKLITNLNFSEIVLIELLTRTKSQYAIAPLKEILDNLIYRSQTDLYDEYKISNILTFILSINPEYLLSIILQLLQNKDYDSKEIIRIFIAYCNLELVNLSCPDCDRLKHLLKQEIKNNDSSIRAIAFECLVRLKDSWAITELKNDYHREYHFYLDKLSIVNICSKTKDESLVEYLIYGLFEDDRSCRFQATEGLKATNKIKEDLVIDVLLHGLCQKIDDECDRGVLNMLIGETLNEISPNKSLEKLALMAQCNDIDVRLNVLKALREFSNKNSLQIATKALEDISEALVIEALTNFIAYCQRNNENIENILSLDSLVNCLKTNNIEIFRLTLDIFTQRYTLGTQSFIPISNRQLIHSILLEKIQNKNKKIRIEAIYNLGYFDDKCVKNQLHQLIEDNDSQIQAYVVNALGNIGDKRDIPLLIAKLQHSEAIVREGAANGLRLMGSELAKQPLIEALKDKNPDVQKSVIEALSVVGGEEIEGYLIELIQNTDNVGVADRIVFVLGIIGGEKTVKFLKQILQNFLSATKREEIEILLDVEIIIDALARIGTTSAIEVILGILPLNSYPANYALDALTNIGGLDIIPRLWEIQLKSKSPAFFDKIACIQKSYQHYHPKYCEITPQNINSDMIKKYINYFKNYTKYNYSRLTDY